MNVMQICPTDDVFFGSINTTGSIKGADYIATKVKWYNVEVGLKNVVQVSTLQWP